MATHPGTVSPNIISSILIAFKQLSPPSVEKLLPLLKGPKPPHDYNFVDAFATLCSFVPQCDSAAAVINSQYDRIYIATRPPASPAMRTVIDALICELPGNTFIVKVYHTFFLERVFAKNATKIKQDDVEMVLEDLVAIQSVEMQEAQGDENPASLAHSGLNVMKSKTRDEISSFSDSQFLDLHNIVQNLAKFKEDCVPCQFLVEAVRISEAVDALVAWATSRAIGGSECRPLNIIFVNPPRVPNFLATTNVDDTALEEAYKKLYNKLISTRPPFEDDPHLPPLAAIAKVEGAPGHFTGPGVVHCVPAILHYILRNNITSTVYPYVGSSHPVCYACHSFMRACHLVAYKPFFTVGRRSYDMEWLDPAWSCPPLDALQDGPAILRRLERNVVDDFAHICELMHDNPYPAYHGVRDIVGYDPREAEYLDRMLKEDLLKAKLSGA